ncbi:hypothetical protein NUK34_08935 [Kerstersia gyiorum]|uniref:hypothetical protein n=1 Tax=Kerstersia gyiorum TaxID=206506 RepID=UPI00214FD023|nr:hypothetical protein [Kerstersia gyiorum]MCR4158975.1 hypothetical protein [Kerstersia gyiorum]
MTKLLFTSPLRQPAYLLLEQPVHTDSPCPPWLQEPTTSYDATAATPDNPATDHDGHWKDALETWLSPCLSLFWPELHALIDWQTAPVFLNKELRRVGGSLYRDRRYVDMLSELHIQGRRTLLLLHAEIQAHMQADFSRRMFLYYTRLQARYPDHDILQFAIITQGKNSRKIRRLEYHYKPLTGNFLILNYSTPVIHLQDWGAHKETLQALAPDNPFALIVLAELHATNTGRNSPQRLQKKIDLVRSLYLHHYSAAEVRQLFLFIDATLHLPEAQSPEFSREIETIERESKMAYISSVERYWKKKWEQVGIQAGMQRGIEQGIEQGARQAIQHSLCILLQQRFGPLSQLTQQRIQQASRSELQEWMLKILEAHTLPEIFS